MTALQVRASFNRQLEECSRGLIRGIEKMQQHAAKARECAAQLNEDTEMERSPETSVPSPADAVKDLVSIAGYARRANCTMSCVSSPSSQGWTAPLPVPVEQTLSVR